MNKPISMFSPERADPNQPIVSRKQWLFWLGALFIAGCLLLVLETQNLLVVLGGALMLFLTFLTYVAPAKMMLFAIIFSTFIPTEWGIKLGSFPLVGPVRVLLLCFLLGLLFRIIVRRRVSYALSRLPLKGPFLFSLFAALISTLLSIDPVRSILSTVNNPLTHLAFFILSYQCCQQPGFWKLSKRVLLWTAFAVCMIAFFEEATHFSLIASVYPEEEPSFRMGLLRVRSTFFHPIALGCFLDLVFPIALAEWLLCKRITKKIVLSLLLFFMALSLFLTLSRFPWLILFIELSVFSIWWARNAFHRKVILAFALTLGLVLATSGLLLFRGSLNSSNELNPFGKVEGTKADEASSEYYRFALARAVWEKLDGPRWLLGYGPGTFHIANVESQYAGHEHLLVAADSHYLKVLLETGFLGGLAFLILIGIAISSCMRGAFRLEESKQVWAVACLAGVIGFVLNNITASMYLLHPLPFIFWLEVALVLAMRIRRANEDTII
ncbi:MAG TPA: O-antigen ligase family protein [Terriglobia bacterium]|nr:O-antigen ligase family protein [Terriglobia bacterium]